MQVTTKRGKCYARLRVWDGYKQSDNLIPLLTTPDDEKETLRRYKFVLEELPNLKKGNIQKFQYPEYFPWLNETGTSKLIKLSLKDIIPEYLKYRKKTVQKGSYLRDGYALKQLTRCLGENKPIQELNYKNIEEDFIPFYLKKGYGNNGVNLSLRTLKVFFTFLLKEKLINEQIQFKMLKKDDTECYINRAEINALHKAVDAKFRRWFYFYEMVGCRAKDPFKGYLDGNVWKISKDETKTKKMHYHPLTDELKYIWMELQDLKQSYLDKGHNEEHAILMSYNMIRRKLNSTIKSLRNDGKIATGKKLTLKSFRHTFGIINVHRTGNIYTVMQMMNHGRIETTQEYLDMPLYLLVQDFPELKRLVVPNSNFQGEVAPDSKIPISPQPLSLRARILGER